MYRYIMAHTTLRLSFVIMKIKIKKNRISTMLLRKNVSELMRNSAKCESDCGCVEIEINVMAKWGSDEKFYEDF